MNKNQQDQKKLEQAQQQHAKEQFRKRQQALAEKQFIAEEWKAEVEIMKYTLEYEELLPKYQEHRAKKEAAFIEQSKTSTENANIEGEGAE